MPKKERPSYPTRVFTFGAKIAKEDLPVALQILRDSNTYYNTLIELERDRRDKYRSLCCDYDPEIGHLTALWEDLDKQCSELEDELSKYRAIHKVRKVPAAVRQPLKDLKRRKSQTWAEVKRRRKLLDDIPAFAQDNARIKEDHTLARTKARADTPIYWGTYLKIEASVKQSIDATDRSPPKFRRYSGNGPIAVQIQKGGSYQEAIPGSSAKIATLLQIGEASPGSHWRDCLIRIGSAGPGNRQPVWLPFRCKIHRDIPEDARIQWAWLQAKRTATTTKWTLQLALARDAGWAPTDRATSGSVAVDLGWREMQDHVRIGTWVGSDGAEGTIDLPLDRYQKRQHQKSIRSQRDELFNALCGVLDTFRHGPVPEWLQERLRYLTSWRSADRLASVILYWRDHRFSGDDEAFGQAEEWRKQDKRLYEEERHLELQWQNWRRDFYRKEAADLSREYHTVIVEDIDWRDFMDGSVDLKEKGNFLYEKRKAQQLAGAVGLLRQILIQRFEKSIRVDPAKTTLRCHHCGHEETWDAEWDLLHTCSACGTTWDQDINACLNMLSTAG